MNRAIFNLCLSAFICGCSSLASAAPPTVTYLYPAGAQRGSTVEVTAAGAFDKWPVKVWTSDKDVRIEAAKEKGKFAVTIGANAVPGVCWLRAFNNDGASSLRPFIVGMLPEVPEKEPNDEPKTAQVISDNVVVNGKFEKAGDVDCFAVNLKKGQTLVASLEANAVIKSPMDAVLQIVSSDGFVLDQNHDFHKLDPQIAFTASKEGRYVVRIFAFPSQPDSSIRFAGADSYIYRLTLTTGGFADHPLPLAVSREKPDPVSLAGWNIPEVARKLTVVPGAEESISLFHPTVANPVNLRLERHPCFDLTPRPQPQPKLVPPFSVTGRIDAPGTDAAVPFVGRKGQALSIQVKSREIGLAVNPVIRVLDAEKKQLSRAEPAQLNGDAALSFTPPADGTYTVFVGDQFSGGGSRHVFLLRVVEPEPDYDLAIASDRFTVPPGKSIDIPIKVARRNGFAKPVEFAAEGLPAGVKFELKPAAGKADPSSVTVTLSGEKAGVAGPFRLVGRVKDEPTFTRAARAPLAEFETSTADLWVTVSDAPAAAPKSK